MIKMYESKELSDLGFKMLINIHDEIVGECPKENASRCAELMSELMVEAGNNLKVPLKCDTDVFFSWYGPKVNPNTLMPLK